VLVLLNKMPFSSKKDLKSPAQLEKKIDI
jgi:hypothetical protein